MSVVWKVSREHLDPTFASDVDKMLAASPFSWLVMSGYRSLEEQTQLWNTHLAGGPLAAPPGKSAHNFGLAVDVAFDADASKPGFQLIWNTKAAGWLWLKYACWKHPRLHSGASFGDWPHIQSTSWGKHPAHV